MAAQKYSSGSSPLCIGKTQSDRGEVRDALRQAAEMKDRVWGREYSGTQALHFGAGVMGKGFANWAYWKSTVSNPETPIRTFFVDVRSAPAVPRINEQGGYTVFEVQNTHLQMNIISNARAIFSDEQTNIDLIVSDPRTKIISTTVSPNILKINEHGNANPVLVSLTNALYARFKKLGGTGPDNGAINIVLCENDFDNGRQAYDAVRITAENRKLPAAFMKWIDNRVGFPRTVVDRIAPSPDALESSVGTSTMGEALTEKLGFMDEQLTVVQADYSWIVENIWRDGTREYALLPEELVFGHMKISDNIKMHETKKLLGLNGPHAILAAVGSLLEHRSTTEAMGDEFVRGIVGGAIAEVTNVLFKHRGFFPTSGEKEFIGEVLMRFEDKSLPDTLSRVRRDPFRKLGANDRLIRSAIQSAQFKQPYDHIALGIASLLICARGLPPVEYTEQDPKKAIYQEHLRNGNVELVVFDTKLTGLSKGSPIDESIGLRIIDMYRRIDNEGIRSVANSLQRNRLL